MKNKRPTLIILSPGFPKDEADSTCLPLQQALIKTLNENFPELHIVILAFDYPFFSGTRKWYTNTVICFNKRKRLKLLKLIVWARIWRTLGKLRRDNNVIGVFSFWCGSCALAGNIFAKRYNLKHYCWILGRDAGLDNPYIKLIKPHAWQLVAISDFIQREFYKNHAIYPVHIIPAGIDAAAFSRESTEKNIDLLAAGSLIPLKQFDIFVEVICRLKVDHPAINAVLCGKGPEEDKLDQLIRAKDLDSNLRLAGELQHSDLLRHMQRSRIFIHTSSYEGFSGVCLEALYAGAVVISFCKPMDVNIPNWYTVDTMEGMLEKVIDVLRQPIVSIPVLPYPIEDSANKIMALFNYRE